ncbi:MAG TPA: hypothetical protein VK658_18820 [Chryseolinea sp.]|nr:hypothetical protein [Chryseolinea sp.]
MRTTLKKLDQVRKKFRGVFQREGKKTNWHGYGEPTILLRSITDDAGKVVTDHLWFNKTKSFDALGRLDQGDVIEFEARITPYRKGYVNRRGKIDESSTDYKLSRPTKLRIVRS